jgi:hypothetical protein
MMKKWEFLVLNPYPVCYRSLQDFGDFPVKEIIITGQLFMVTRVL